MAKRSKSQQSFESNKFKGDESNDLISNDRRTADLNSSDIPLNLTVDHKKKNSKQPTFDSRSAGRNSTFNRQYVARTPQKVQKVNSNQSSSANANKQASGTQNACGRTKSYGFMSGVSPPVKPKHSAQNSFNKSATPSPSATAAGNVGLNMSMANAKNIDSSGVASADKPTGFIKVSPNKEDAPWFKKTDQSDDSYAHPKYTERTSSPQKFPYNEGPSTSSGAVARSMPHGFIGVPAAHQNLPTDRSAVPLSAIDYNAHHTQSIGSNNMPSGFMGPINMELPIGQSTQAQQPDDPHVQPTPTPVSTPLPVSGGCELTFHNVDSTSTTTTIPTATTQDSNKILKDTSYCRQVPSIHNTNPLVLNSPQQISDQNKLLSPHDNTGREQHITDNNVATSGRGNFFAGLMDCPANNLSASRLAAAGDGNSMPHDRLQARSSVGQWPSLQEGSFIRSNTNSIPKTVYGGAIDNKEKGAGGDTVAASLNFVSLSYKQPKAEFVLNSKDFPALNKRNKKSKEPRTPRTPRVETTTANIEKTDMVFPVQKNPLPVRSRAEDLVALAKLNTKDEEFSTVFGQQNPETSHGSNQRNDVKPEVQLPNVSSAMKTNQLPALVSEQTSEASQTNSSRSGAGAQTNEHVSVLKQCPLEEKFPVQQDLNVSGTRQLEPKCLYPDKSDVALPSSSISVSAAVSQETCPPEPKSENNNSNIIQDQYGLLGLAAAIRESKKNAAISQWLFGSPLETLQTETDLPEPNMFDNMWGVPQESQATRNWFHTLPDDFWRRKEYKKVNNNRTQYTNQTLPDCYKFDDKLRISLPKKFHFTSLTDDQLFLIFYTQPKTANQLLASAALYDHGWWYFLGNKIWIRKQTQSQVQHNTFGGAADNVCGNAGANICCGQCEVTIVKGLFQCFDAINWRIVVAYLEFPSSLIDKYPDLSSIASALP